MAPTKFFIELDNMTGSYFPGQVLTGKVILELDQEKNTQGLKLKINGEATVSWQEFQGQISKGFTGKEQYFHTKMVLLGDEKNTDVTIPAGSHEYPFSFELPPNIPSSFSGEFGNVSYEIEAVVKRSWKFDYSTKLMFSVNALVDLNLLREYEAPSQASKEKSICCMCCKQGPISMRVGIPRVGYVPGEFIKFSVDAGNSSSRPVSAIVVNFIREISYKADGGTKHATQELVKTMGPKVQPFLSETWQHQIQIPPVPPTDLGGCKIIQVSYFLKFKLDIPTSIDLKKKLPIYVGTVPYLNFLPEYVPPPKGKEFLHAAHSSAPPFPLLEKYPDMPLPVFQDAVAWGKNSNKDAKVLEQDGDGTDNKSENTVQDSNSKEKVVPTQEVGGYSIYIPKYATYDYGWNFKVDLPDQNGFK